MKVAEFSDENIVKINACFLDWHLRFWEKVIPSKVHTLDPTRCGVSYEHKFFLVQEL